MRSDCASLVSTVHLHRRKPEKELSEYAKDGALMCLAMTLRRRKEYDTHATQSSSLQWRAASLRSTGPFARGPQEETRPRETHNVQWRRPTKTRQRGALATLRNAKEKEACGSVNPFSIHSRHVIYNAHTPSVRKGNRARGGGSADIGDSSTPYRDNRRLAR